MKTEEMVAKFKEVFGAGGDIRVYFAPGRVNLIGEHTDYNGGHVFPCALTLGTYGVVRKSMDHNLRFYSLNFEDRGILESSIDELKPDPELFWANYPKGVLWAFDEKGMRVDYGFDLLIWGNIPNGSGLSSSASLEVLTGTLLKDLYGFDVENEGIALLCQRSENHYNGMNCGIMDQFASAMGKKDHAIFLDTATLEYEYAPVKLRDQKIVVTNSRVKHSLVDSAYNDRRRECETALKELKKAMRIKTLGELTEEEFDSIQDAIPDAVRRKRAKHAVYENRRTIRAVEALKKNDLAAFGRLMNESHISLRDDYEVSCEEIDCLVETAWRVDGVLGSRITGGGFGGCTVSIVENAAVEEFERKVLEEYKIRFNREGEVYVVDIGGGPERIV
ncbi:MAG: galactokinase [Lachnospiraceae bacterium]|nr:galactokinase [Lachnospiraceae bacterium]